MQFGRIRFFLIIGLLASNLIVGVCSLYLLRSMDQRYAALFDRSLPLVNNLRTLTRELGGVQRLARRISDPQNESEWSVLVDQLDESSNRAKDHGQEVGGMVLLKETKYLDVIGRLSREYDEKVDAFLDLARARKISEANRYNAEVLRPAYDRYLDALEEVAGFTERTGSDLRLRYTADARMYGRFLLAVAGWPLLAVAGVVVVMGLLLIGLFTAVFFPRIFPSKSPAA